MNGKRRWVCAVLATTVVALIATTAGSAPRPASSPQRPASLAVDAYGERNAREIVLTDIGNEPDDQMSLVRHLLYANEIDLEGIILTTSTWKKVLDEASVNGALHVVDAYARVQPNLAKHDRNYPPASNVRSLVVRGVAGYGLAAMSKTRTISEGARRIIERAEAPDGRPLWITIAGGGNTLAEALNHVRKTRDAAALARFVRKLRVYAISDQDDSNNWMRKTFPGLAWIGTPSDQTSDQYSAATWTAISGEHLYRKTTVMRGPDATLVTHAWLAQHVQAKGPLGQAYPTYTYIMEGDTPSWLNLIRNGLAAGWHPTWGGWGGRYIYTRPTGGPTVEPRSFYTNGSCAWGASLPVLPAGSPDPDCTRDARSADTVVGADGLRHKDDFATVYRWRQALQWDFSNRMDWTTKSFAEANHAPGLVVNGIGGSTPICLLARTGQAVQLSARGSRDPDGDAISFAWSLYPEAGTSHTPPAPARLSTAAGTSTIVTGSSNGTAHVILTGIDDGGTVLGEPFPARTYRRVLLTLDAHAAAAPQRIPCG